ncbi:MAG: hypothetical protein CVU54_15480 [Deltaproteobacteria bacterium HGW-Deltaproteobacteria-12]|nr:MAG: hypothetical protein CVU54_15480 [Deltaproteobacteria bacterium HGW-Deltaproteobacteria-12]
MFRKPEGIGTCPRKQGVSEVRGNMKYFAHTLPGKPPADWQPLEEHLKKTAEQAKEFTSAFGAGDWGYLAGLWPDKGQRP